MAWPLLLAVAGLALLAALMLLNRRRHGYWRRRGVPCPEPVPPLLGSFAPALLGRKTFFQTAYELSGRCLDTGYCGGYMALKPALLVWDPEMVKQVLCKDFSSFHDRGQPSDEADPLSQHLFNLNGTKWRNLRNKLSPTFTSGKLKLMLPLMREVADELSAVMAAAVERAAGEGGGSGELDVAALLGLFATDVIGTCAFGIQCNCLRDHEAEFLAMSRRVFKVSPLQIVRILLDMIHPKLGVMLLPFKLIMSNVHHFFINLITETVEYREKNKVERNDFLQLMMQLRDADLGALDPDHHLTLTPGLMAAQAFVFFLAGLDNVSNTVAHCACRMAADPALQERVAREVRDVVRDHDGQVTYEALKKMELVERVLLEGLRTWGPVSLLARKCNATTKVGDVTVEKGTAVLIVTERLHNDPRAFPEPRRFDPDRHTAAARAQRHPYAFLPFGEGPRVCIAERFALLEMKLALAVLARDFRFECGPGFEAEPELDRRAFFPRPLRGMRLRVCRRQP